MDKLQPEEIQEYWEAAQEAGERFLETMAEILIPVVEEITRLMENFSRSMFSIRLQDSGMPDWLADFVAYHWPKRWLPYGWIHQNDIN